MSCERFEDELALYVEGDLPVRQRPSIERHLATCARCRDFELGLRRSQTALKDLADAELPEAAITATHTRIIAAARSSPRSAWTPVRWAWIALACGAVALGVAVLWRSVERVPSPAPSIAQTEPPRRHALQQITAPILPPDSTKTVGERVSRSVQRLRRPDGDQLTREEADQLARALVLVSQLRGEVGGPLVASQTVKAAQTPLARIATDDPNVVIYWQFDPNGG